MTKTKYDRFWNASVKVFAIQVEYITPDWQMQEMSYTSQNKAPLEQDVQVPTVRHIT